MAPPVARTAAEALLFLRLLPCETCGALETDWQLGALLTVDGSPAEQYVGRCARCGTDRDFAFSPAPGPSTGHGTFGGDRPSELLDAAQWLDVATAAETSAARAGTPHARREDLAYARDAVDEAMKFLPPGAAAVPESALFSPPGRQSLATDPLRLTRDWMRSQRDTITELLTDLDRAALDQAALDQAAAPSPGEVGREPAGAGSGDAGGGFDNAVDVERARRWLRGRLVATASGVYPEVTPTVERDDGPVPSEPGPPDQPGTYLCAVTVTTGAAAPPWDAADAIAVVGRILAADDWEVTGRGRFEVTGRRDGYVVVAAMTQEQGILRLSGETPLFLLPPEQPATPENQGPAGTGDGRWQPATDEEEALLLARQRGDMRSFFALIRELPLYLPVAADPDDPAAAVTYGTLTVDDRVYLATYTSPETLAYALGDGIPYQETGYRQLAAAWPDPGWELAVNGGTPIEVYVGVPDLAAAADAPAPWSATGDFRPANDVEQALYEAVGRADRAAVVAALTRAPLTLWTPVAAGDAARSRVGDPDFRWSVTTVDDTPSVSVFTSAERAAEGAPAGADLVETTLSQVARAWPDRSYQLVVDPGSAIAVTLPGFAVPSLAEPAGDERPHG